MAARRSAGLLLHRWRGGTLQVLLVHPGGPFWARKDEGAWSVPKGELEQGDDPLATALREFAEELGCPPPDGPLHELGTVRQPGGKEVAVWTAEGDVDVSAVTSNTFELEWPPRSGRVQAFPEVDRAEWFDLPSARAKLLKGQLPFLDRLAAAVDGPAGRDSRP